MKSYKFKNFMLLILSFLFSFSIGTVGVFAENNVVFSIKSVSAKSGDIVKIPINVLKNENNGISSFGMLINYDSNYLTPVSCEKGIWANDIVVNTEYSKNQIFVASASNKNFTQNGEFIYVSFKVKDNVSNVITNLSVSFDELRYSTGTGINDFVDIVPVLQAGMVSIGVETQDDISKWDVDGDGELTANDLSILLQKVLDSSFKLPNE